MNLYHINLDFKFVFLKAKQHYSNILSINFRTDVFFIMITSTQTSGLHLLVPSSETMPSPSALFCLSKAFRSRTLRKRAKFNWMQRSRIRKCRSKSEQGKTNQHVCISAWRLRKKPTSFLSLRYSSIFWQEGKEQIFSSATLIGFTAKALIKNTHPLNFAVSTVENGDTQFEGRRHHWTSLACMQDTQSERRSQTWSWNWTFVQTKVSLGLTLPLQALIICSTISAAPRLWSLDCWYRSLCFSISFSCTGHSVMSVCCCWRFSWEFKQIEWTFC